MKFVNIYKRVGFLVDGNDHPQLYIHIQRTLLITSLFRNAFVGSKTLTKGYEPLPL
jgi:hypothetical protein